MKRIPNPLIDELAADLAPVAPVRLWHGAVLVALAVLVTLLLVETIHGLWPGIAAGEASSIFFLANGMLGLLGTASALAVVRMASPSVGNSHEGARWAVAMLAVLPLSALAIVGMHGLVPTVLHDSNGFDCFIAGSGFGLVTAAALVAWLRRGAPVSFNAAGVFTGIAAGAIGSCAYGLACPVDTIAHLGIWHIAPVLLLGLAGRFIVPPLVRW